MSRKRKQSKRAAAPAPVKQVEIEAVPEEILAEGSGSVAHADAVELAEAANAVGRRRKKRRTPEQVAEISTESASSGQSDGVSADGEDATSNGAERIDDAVSSGSGAAMGFDADGVAELAADRADAADLEATDAAVDAADAAVDAAAEADAAVDSDAELRADGEAADAAATGGDAAELEAAVDPEAGVELEGEAREEAAVADDSLAADGGEAGDEDGGEAGAVLPTSAASMDAVQLKHLVEALVFASDKPLTVARLRQLTRVSDTKRLEQALADITEDFRERGIVLQQVSGGYQFRTRTQFSAWVQQLIAGRPVRLSRAQLETLAIIAYRQPITRPEIDEIRGVDSSATLKLLIDRALIRILGKKEEVGRPMLYGTTKEFLEFFHLKDLKDLPTLREFYELSEESMTKVRELDERREAERESKVDPPPSSPAPER